MRQSWGGPTPPRRAAQGPCPRTADPQGRLLLLLHSFLFLFRTINKGLVSSTNFLRGRERERERKGGRIARLLRHISCALRVSGPPRGRRGGAGRPRSDGQGSFVFISVHGKPINNIPGPSRPAGAGPVCTIQFLEGLGRGLGSRPDTQRRVAAKLRSGARLHTSDTSRIFSSRRRLFARRKLVPRGSSILSAQRASAHASVGSK